MSTGHDGGAGLSRRHGCVVRDGVWFLLLLGSKGGRPCRHGEGVGQGVRGRAHIHVRVCVR